MESAGQQPAFILGCGRSGTTLVQRILNSHGDFTIWGETGRFMGELADSYFSFREYEPSRTNIWEKNGGDVKKSAEKLRDAGHWSAWETWFKKDEVVDNYRSFVHSFFKPLQVKTSFWGFKEIRFGRTNRLPYFLDEVLKGCRFVFVFRNPLDVVVSQVERFFKNEAGVFEQRVDKWVEKNTALLEFAKDNAEKCMFLEYELLARDRDYAVDRLLGFFGLDAGDEQYKVCDIVLDAKGGDGLDPSEQQISYLRERTSRAYDSLLNISKK